MTLYLDLCCAFDWLTQISLAARPIRSTTWNSGVTSHQFGISAPIPQTSIHTQTFGCFLRPSCIKAKNTQVIQMAFLPKSFGQQSAIPCRAILHLMTQWMQVQNSLHVHWKERSLILLPLHPASLMHNYPQKWKIIHGMSPAGHRDRSIDLNLCICRNISFM